MNRRIQTKKKRSTYAWDYMDASKQWKGKVLTKNGLAFVLRVLCMKREEMA